MAPEIVVAEDGDVYKVDTALDVWSFGVVIYIVLFDRHPWQVWKLNIPKHTHARAHTRTHKRARTHARIHTLKRTHAHTTHTPQRLNLSHMTCRSQTSR